jgi:hypothetical protein
VCTELELELELELDLGGSVTCTHSLDLEIWQRDNK